MTTIKYTNGNYLVSIDSDGTKIRYHNGDPDPTYPELIDLKITNYCSANCKFCHEKSTIKGSHGDIEACYNYLRQLPKGVELAIAGGNELDHPELQPFLKNLNKQGLITNLTVNALHLRDPWLPLLQNLIKNNLTKGVGISHNHACMGNYGQVFNNNTVFHFIAGVNNHEDIITLKKRFTKIKVLVLGFKNFGFGQGYKSKVGQQLYDNLYAWYTNIHKYLIDPDILISFDNLGLEQLNIIRFFNKEAWSKIYMGEEGQFTMYIDAVKKEYAVTSTSKERYSIGDKGIKEMFAHIRSKSINYKENLINDHPNYRDFILGVPVEFNLTHI